MNKNFTTKRAHKIKELNAEVIELEHKKTGAKHIHIARADKNCAFAVVFKTLPSDSTGVAHILEHTVLAGSRKFPVADPFFYMMDSSLNSFMNAFTAMDWTMYPFASPAKKDFYNLLDVYLDASFFPLIDELSFRQEGWRYDFDDQENLVYKGVVYNEMQGSMSSPSRVFEEAILEHIYPETVYHYNSGGDPAVIPNLTHKQLKDFHQTYYHPTNAKFYSYGDLNLDELLEFIDKKVLSEFSRLNFDFEVRSQPRWSAPRRARVSYPLSKEENASKKTQVGVSWLVGDIADTYNFLIIAILERVLLGNSSAPLYKSLIESGLGSSLCDDYGLDADFSRDIIFLAGLKDIKKEDAGKVEDLILKTLKDLAKKGIDKNLIKSAIHKLEFEHREIRNSRYTYGLDMLFSFLGSWLHNGDGLDRIDLLPRLEKIKKENEKGGFFEEKIKEFFLDNTHRLRLEMVPDKNMSERAEAIRQEKLKNEKEKMSPADTRKIKKINKDLEAKQNKKENSDCLPKLEITDIPKLSSSTEPREIEEKKHFAYSENTGGIVYFSSLFGLGSLSEAELDILSFLSFALPRITPKGEDKQSWQNEIDLFLGSLSFETLVEKEKTKEGEPSAFLKVKAKALSKNSKKIFDILGKIFSSADFGETKKIKQLFLEFKTSFEAEIVNSGHRMAIASASENLDKSFYLKEKLGGFRQFLFLKKTAKNLDEKEKVKEIISLCERICKKIFTKNNFTSAIIAEPESIKKSQAEFRKFKNKLAEGEESFDFPEVGLEKKEKNKLWTTQTEVSFCASVFVVPGYTHPDAPALAVLAKLLKSKFIHKELREKGGAYGGISGYQGGSGLFFFASYRDPQLKNTFDVFDKSFGFIKSGKFTDQDIKDAILYLSGDFDQPATASEQAERSFYRQIFQFNDKKRQDFFEGLKKVNKKKVIETAEKYLANAQFSKSALTSEAIIKREGEMNEFETKKI